MPTCTLTDKTTTDVIFSESIADDEAARRKIECLNLDAQQMIRGLWVGRDPAHVYETAPASHGGRTWTAEPATPPTGRVILMNGGTEVFNQTFGTWEAFRNAVERAKLAIAMGDATSFTATP